MKMVKVPLFLFLVMISSNLNAQDPKVEPPPDDLSLASDENLAEPRSAQMQKKEALERAQGERSEALTEESMEEEFIRRNIEISEWFDGVAEGIDLFLVGRRVSSRPNESSITVENSTTVRAREDVTNSFGIGANLRLPNVEDYWQLKFTSYDERRDRRENRREFLRQQERERNYGATVGLFKKLGEVRTSFQPRIELQDPFRISHALIFESVAEYRTYEVNPRIEFFANPDEGVGTFQSINVNLILSKVFSLTFVNEGKYEEKSHFFDVTNGVVLGQEIQPEKSSIAYGIYTNSNNRDEYHLESYTLAVTWSDLVYKKILDYQISPHVLFPRVYSFAATPGVTLSIYLNF